ncbi:hypothetical protein [Enterococcus gallinarum]|uniref:hypothetical protein n=1 Tax=Enterococcus gallinarum TaxID=1353 RepID=UPI001D175F16|nr:hypothetical protein [Enterococcus gallinarum]MCC4046588.1 hypothetical protein [Enterococcus gallinarum]
MVKIENLSKSAFQPKNEDKTNFKNFLKTFENDIIVKNTGGKNCGGNTEYERATNKNS